MKIRLFRDIQVQYTHTHTHINPPWDLVTKEPMIFPLKISVDKFTERIVSGETKISSLEYPVQKISQTTV